MLCFFLSRDDLDRKLQAERTAEILADSAHPVVMLSYITNPTGSRDYWKIINDGKVKVQHNFIMLGIKWELQLLLLQTMHDT